MDRNFLLACALSFLVISLWAMTQTPPADPGKSPAGQETSEAVPATRDASSEKGTPQTSRYPTLAAPPSAPGSTTPQSRQPEAERATPATEQTLTIARPLYEAQLSSTGATLSSWRLLQYTDHGDPIHLVPGDGEPSLATPFPELGLGDPGREAWRVERSEGDQVVFVWQRDGIRLRKTYRFSEDGYDFRLLVEIENGSQRNMAPAFLTEWPIQGQPGNDFRELSASALAAGSVESTPLASLGSPGFFGRLSGARAGEPVELEGEIDWAGVQTPYFLAAVFPDQPSAARGRVVSLEAGRLGVVQIYFQPVTLAPGQSAAREFRVYAGPKEIERLNAFAPSATASIELGWAFIAPMTRTFGWLLAVLYSFIPNYGVAIILLTILVRVVTAPLTLKQMKSMERMRRIQPKVKEIQEKFADDRQKQSEAMMSLYRQEKVNPLGGCLPMVLQLPVFIGLFYALRSSIQLRQAPFFGWINDLSAPDLLFTVPGLDLPVRVLPLLMGASMFVQQKITPMQMDPTQARMMLILMPIMMTVISYQFPSGLVLYWMLSNVLAIGHQLWIGRKMDPTAASRAAPGKA